MGNNVVCGGVPDERPVGFRRFAPYEVRLAVTEILHVAGVSGYHTSVVVDDREYFFDCLGIMVAAPLWSHLAGQMKLTAGPNTEMIPMGRSSCSGNRMVQALIPHFEKGSYDIFCKNCNSFSDAALYYLTRSRLDGRFNRIERVVTATDPVSVGLINRLLRAPGEAGEPPSDFYVRNPEADGFSVEELIASFDESESDSEAASGDSSDSDSARACSLTRHTCYAEPKASRSASRHHSSGVQ
mmetsp:Transcript_41279/g.111545  ORF Transcript_41279/g.111545 Transcript_41279/m.111545 type:complete len:241 (-) Transcript_41279:79-801(-)